LRPERVSSQIPYEEDATPQEKTNIKDAFEFLEQYRKTETIDEEEGLSFLELTKKLKSLITEEQGRHVKVKPKLVVTVLYQNIQKSPTYTSGYALRFPRVIKLREDRGPEGEDLGSCAKKG